MCYGDGGILVTVDLCVEITMSEVSNEDCKGFMNGFLQQNPFSFTHALVGSGYMYIYISFLHTVRQF
jgi:hypothetical protein